MNGPVTRSPEAVREELRRILESPPFATAARARRFLTYIVEQTLAGQSDGIKELVLASEVSIDRLTSIPEWTRSCASKRGSSENASTSTTHLPVRRAPSESTYRRERNR